MKRLFKTAGPTRWNKLKPTRRSGDGESHAPKFLERLEAGVVGTLRFISGVLTVLWRVATRPWHLERYIGERGRLGTTIPPYTFLALATFLAIKAARLTLTTTFLILLAAERSCAPETQIDVTFPDVSAVLSVPTVEDLLYTGLPAVLLILLVVHTAITLCTRRRVHTRQRLVYLCAYIIGFQYVLLAAFVAVALPYAPYLAAWNGDQGEQLFDLMASWRVFAACFVAVVIVWPALLITARLVRSTDAPAGRAQAVARLLMSGIVALALSLATVLAGTAVTYPQSRLDLQRQILPRPVLEIALVRALEATPDELLISLAVTNQSSRDVVVLPSQVAYQYKKGDTLYFASGSLVPGAPSEGAAILLGHGKTHLVDVAVRTAPDTPSRACLDTLRSQYKKSSFTGGENATIVADIWGLAHLRYPHVPGVVGRLCLGTVDRVGGTVNLLAYVRRPAD